MPWTMVSKLVRAQRVLSSYHSFPDFPVPQHPSVSSANSPHADCNWNEPRIIRGLSYVFQFSAIVCLLFFLDIQYSLLTLPRYSGPANGRNARTYLLLESLNERSYPTFVTRYDLFRPEKSALVNTMGFRISDPLLTILWAMNSTSPTLGRGVAQMLPIASLPCRHLQPLVLIYYALQYFAVLGNIAGGIFFIMSPSCNGSLCG